MNARQKHLQDKVKLYSSVFLIAQLGLWIYLVRSMLRFHQDYMHDYAADMTSYAMLLIESVFILGFFGCWTLARDLVDVIRRPVMKPLLAEVNREA